MILKSHDHEKKLLFFFPETVAVPDDAAVSAALLRLLGRCANCL